MEERQKPGYPSALYCFYPKPCEKANNGCGRCGLLREQLLVGVVPLLIIWAMVDVSTDWHAIPLAGWLAAGLIVCLWLASASTLAAAMRPLRHTLGTDRLL